jgi:putative acetyltransferase
MIVRAERPGDEAQIRAVHLAAFPTPVEADLVEQLKVDGDAAISLVADDDSEIVGHVLFSRMEVEADRRPVEALALAPVAVLPHRQRRGIGSALIEAGLREAQAHGAELVFLVGEPDYYRRFGFAAATAAPFESPYAGPYFQAKVLGNDFTRPASGRADYAAAFAGLE